MNNINQNGQGKCTSTSNARTNKWTGGWRMEDGWTSRRCCHRTTEQDERGGKGEERERRGEGTGEGKEVAIDLVSVFLARLDKRWGIKCKAILSGLILAALFTYFLFSLLLISSLSFISSIFRLIIIIYFFLLLFFFFLGFSFMSMSWTMSGSTYCLRGRKSMQ